MAVKPGKVYLVGAGPGDPELMTLKAMRLLRQADAVVYDRLANPRMLSEVKSGVEMVYVGKASNRHTLPQDKINALLVKLAKRGKNVVRLKGGDPFVFGRGGEEILELVKHNISFEVVPGITSAISVPSYAGIPVTHRGITSGFGVFTGQEDPNKPDSSIAWDKISTGLGTLVFLMGVENLDKITKALIAHGRNKNTACALIQWGTLPQQRTVAGTLATIALKAAAAKITPPAILVVGDVVSLRRDFNWFEKQPLFGKRVLITLPTEDNSRLSGALESLGAACEELPLIAIQPLDDYSALDTAIKDIDQYQWIVFTSQNGVRFFKDRLVALHYDIRQLKGVRVATIGPKTKEAVEALGIRIDLQPEKYTQEGLLEEFKQRRIRLNRILLVRAQEARDVLPQGLQKLGALVTIEPAYRAQIREEKIADASYLNRFDLITFTSSSCVQGFVSVFSKKQIKDKRNTFEVASIGPITSDTARKAGLKVAVEAKEYTLEGLARAIVKYY
jgi:uroporphyrinogen III methyltransferase/synthase